MSHCSRALAHSLGPARFPHRAGLGHPGVIVPVGIAITSDQLGDIGVAEAGVAAAHDRESLVITEAMTPATGPISGASTRFVGYPCPSSAR
jgi:hypothetical protein